MATSVGNSGKASGNATLAEMASGAIRIRGARVHNLQNIDLDIPRDRMVVITGPSGSGKSSLAFDTLFAEGQRQYIESLSVFARQFLHQMERPDVDLIEGLEPTICIDQRAGSQNPRSTVATVTEIYDYLRLLYARLSDPMCHNCGATIHQQSPEQIIADLCELPSGTKLMIMAPLVRGRKGSHKETLEAIRKAGFVRVRVDGEIVDIDQVGELALRKNHSIDAVVDRVVVREGAEPRLAESTRLALSHGEGAVLAVYLDPASVDAQGKPDTNAWQERLYSTLYACPHCKISFAEIEPRTFSFNSPYGACPTCEGLGAREQFDPELIILDEHLSLANGAVVAWKTATAASVKKLKAHFKTWFSDTGLDWETPLEQYKPKHREQLLHGDGRKFPGVLTLLEQQFSTSLDAAERERLEALRGVVTCLDCGGARLRAEARACRFQGLAIHELTALSVHKAGAWFAGLTFTEKQQAIAQPIVREISNRLAFLENVGVEYLTLDRTADTLSGGELQRVRLATGIGSALVGVCYVLDEPSIGLHQRDNQRLIQAMRGLQQQGNTVLVVEHDEAIMRESDYLIDVGPGAGIHGGRIVAQGTPSEVAADLQSVTGQYLAGKLKIEVPETRRRGTKSHSLQLDGATTNNLKNVDLRVPLSALVCVTGVSGSGKSSLINGTLARAVRRRLTGVGPKPGPHVSLRVTSQIDKLIEIDQAPIGRTPRSNPATYTGVFDEIRKVFAGTREARLHGYKTGRFSFNVKGGRCEECQGQGVRRIEMNFLPDLTVPCPVCGGARFNRQTLEVRYRGLSIAEVLDLQVDEALQFFENFPQILRLLVSLQDVGLGYLSLGQASTTLSGGEAQRIKLATELARVNTGKTLYILDEPTTGLHFDDIKKLLAVLDRLVALGNTVLVIEHNLDVAKCADWIIDLGPGGGENGGQIVATGTPEEIAAITGNATGEYLRPLLGLTS